MTPGLMLHAGGWEATLPDLLAVEVPPAQGTHCPVPYGRLVEEVKLQLPRFGLEVAKERFALSHKGQQMFGVFTVVSELDRSDYALAIGLRSSLDKSLAIGMAGGSNVFICDNLAFNGEVTLSRKSTPNAMRDLPDMIYQMLGGVRAMQERTDAEILAYKDAGIGPMTAHHLMVEAIELGAIPASRLPHLLEAWNTPQHEVFQERTAWSLFNAFTHVLKASPARLQIEGSLKLSNLFRQELCLTESLPSDTPPTPTEVEAE